jgi:hypothetical protein
MSNALDIVTMLDCRFEIQTGNRVRLPKLMDSPVNANVGRTQGRYRRTLFKPNFKASLRTVRPRFFKRITLFFIDARSP